MRRGWFVEKLWIVYSPLTGYNVVKAVIRAEAIDKVKRRVYMKYKDSLREYARFIVSLPDRFFTVQPAEIIE